MKPDELITIRKSELIRLCAVIKIEAIESALIIEMFDNNRDEIFDQIEKDINKLIESGDLQTINPN